MKAMIFAAGLGTRFKPWTDKHPKALALVNGKSLLQRNVEWLQQFGITDVIVNVHHFPEQVMRAVEHLDVENAAENEDDRQQGERQQLGRRGEGVVETTAEERDELAVGRQEQ